MHGLVRCNINTGVRARGGGADVSLRDVTIAHIGSWFRGAGDVTHRKSAEDFGRFWKCPWVEMRSREKTVGFCLLAGAARVGGAAEKARIERLCFSPYVKEPLNSKVIKNVSYLNWEVVMCFSFFEIPMFYVYM